MVNDAHKQKILGEVFNFAKLISYKEDSIVSKTLIDKKSGTVTLFSFDKGQGLSEHVAPFDALVFVIDGEAEITISGKPHIVKQGQMIIMPSKKPRL